LYAIFPNEDKLVPLLLFVDCLRLSMFSDPINLLTSQFLFLSITTRTLEIPTTIQREITMAAMPPPLIPPSEIGLKSYSKV